MRITLFQEQIAWFHDLDRASCLDLRVIVADAAASPSQRNPVQQDPADAHGT
jgi:hypothetical protein